MKETLLGYKIGIIGPKGHIGQNLVQFFRKQRQANLFLLKRSGDPKKFFSKKMDLVINCSGISNPKDVKRFPKKVKKITELMDKKILSYLEKYPKSLAIFFSSGSVYPKFNSMIKRKGKKEYKSLYAQAKKDSERKHRTQRSKNIIDLRLFGFLSPLLNLTHGFFLSDLAKCYLKKDILHTSRQNIYRDYLHPEDLFSAILLCIKYFQKHKKINKAFDLYTKRPCSKKEILKLFKVKTTFSHYKELSTQKIHYYSKDRAITKLLKFRPKYSSLETIKSFKRSLEKEKLSNRNLS